MEQNDAFAKASKDITESVSHVLIFRQRSLRLASRLVQLIDSIPNLNGTDLHAKASVSLLAVTVDDLVDYYKLISLKSPALIAHLLKYGSDEECFYKWNERLRLICNSLNMNKSMIIFDTTLDRQDLHDDVKRLRVMLPSLTKNGQDLDLISKLLDSQETNAYKTVQDIDNGAVIKSSMIKYDSLLGKGAFGEVWKARIRSDFVAVKKIPKSLLDGESKAKLKSEAEVMKSLSHPGIVACIGLVDEDTDVCLVMELCSLGSLENLITTRKDLDLKIRVDLALDIANAMSYLHRLNVVHRDLKPGNIVMDDNMRPKITDFGLAFIQSTAMTSFRGTEMGTPAFMAPECFGLTPIFSTRSDVYAFSIIMWELLHMKQAYQGVNALEIRDSIREGQRLTVDPSLPESLVLLITQTWDQNPRARPNFVEITNFLKLYVSSTEPTEFAEGSLIKSLKLTGVGVSDTLPKISTPRDLKNSPKYPISPVEHKPPPKRSAKDFFKGKAFKLALLIFLILLAIAASVIIYIVVISNKSETSPTTQISTSASPQATALPHYKPITSTSVVNVSTLVHNYAAFGDIWGITIDEDDNLYVATSTLSSGTVYKVNSNNGSFSTVYDFDDDGLGRWNDDQGICYYNGSLFLPRIGQITKIDLRNNSHATKFSGTGKYNETRINGDPRVAVFSAAVACIIDSQGNLYVTDSRSTPSSPLTSYIRKVNRQGFVSTFFASKTIKPQSLGFDIDGNLLIADYDGQTLWKRENSTTATPLLQTLSNLGAVVSDIYGNLFVIDTNGQQVYWIEPKNYPRPIAGKLNTAGYVDDLGFNARFDTPRQVVLDSKGRLFLADQDNRAIRMISWT